MADNSLAKSILNWIPKRNLDDICRPIVICNEEHRFIVGHQMKEINIEPLEIILEPEGRNTTPAITIAALKAFEIFKDKNNNISN